MSGTNLLKPFTYGRKSSIHKINDYQVIKLYSKGMSTKRIEEEFNKTRLVWKSEKLNVPEPIKLIKINSRYGITFQRIKGISYMEIFQKKPWLFFSKIKEIANIQRKVHEQKIDGLPTQEEEFHNLISQSPRINEKEKKMLLGILAEKYNPVLCHGDFHHGNLIETKDKKTYIIDWMDAFSGSYQLDVSLTAVNAIVSTSPDHVPTFYRNAYELLKRIIPLDKIYLRNYDKNFDQSNWNNYMWLASGIHLTRCEEKEYKFHLKYFRTLGTSTINGKDCVFKLKDGRNLGYTEYGNPKGKPLFFFHGWPGSRFSGKETNEAGRKLGVRIISTDRPGIGLSDYKRDRELLDWPDDIVELADHLKIKRFSIMGVSGGGPYVAVCAYKIPERINKAGIVVGLAPVDVKGNLDGMVFQGKAGWANYHRFPILRILSALGAAIQFKYFPALGSLMAFPTKQDRLMFNEAVRNKAGEESGVKEAFRQGIKGPSEELRVYTDNWGFNLKDIKAKVFLWYGAKDKCAPLKMGKYYESQIPGSKLFIDQDGGHLSRYTFEDKILRTLID